MKNQRQLQEALLQSWMAMEVCIRGNRLLSDLSMNEMLICNVLYQRRDGAPVTATELCSQTKLLKSQMNHILNTMEYQGLICRDRSVADKRQVYVRLQEAAIPRYLQEHERVLKIVGAVLGTLGEEDTTALTELMQKAAFIVNNIKEDPQCQSKS